MYSASNGLVLICYMIVCYPAMSLAMLSVTVIPSSPFVLQLSVPAAIEEMLNVDVNFNLTN